MYRPRIVVVTDNPRSRRAARIYLSSQNASPEMAGVYLLARRLLYDSEKPPDGAIFDVFHPYSKGSQMRELGYSIIEMMRMDEIRDLGCGDSMGHHYEELDRLLGESEVNQALGIELARGASRTGLPFVLVTSRRREDLGVRAIADHAKRNKWALIDCEPGETGMEETGFWEKAYRVLLKKMEWEPFHD